MKKFLVAGALGAAMLVGASAANAAVIFSEDFTGEAAGGTVLNFTAFDQFNVAQGSVDIIASGGFGITCVGGTGGCVDLDGSTSSNPTSSFVSQAISFQAGFTYSLSFAASGNQRNGATDSINVTIAGPGGVLLSETVTLAGNAAFQTFSFLFTATVANLATIGFFTAGPSDFVGLILDNVAVNSITNGVEVPLPAAAPLLLMGLAGLGAAARRRKAATK